MRRPRPSSATARRKRRPEPSSSAAARRTRLDSCLDDFAAGCRTPRCAKPTPPADLILCRDWKIQGTEVEHFVELILEETRFQIHSELIASRAAELFQIQMNYSDFERKYALRSKTHVAS